jgi:hypothetical protein
MARCLETVTLVGAGASTHFLNQSFLPSFFSTITKYELISWHSSLFTSSQFLFTKIDDANTNDNPYITPSPHVLTL